jgi:hypothetical protein
MSSTKQQIGFGIYLGLFTIITIPPLVLFYHRRHLFPIAQRYPLYILYCQIIFGLDLFIKILDEFVIPLYVPETLDFFSTIFISGYSFTLLVARAWRFYFDFTSARDKLAQRQSSWSLAHQAFIRDSFLKWVSVGGAVFYSMVGLIVSLTSKSRKVAFADGYASSEQHTFSMICGLLNFVLMLIISIKLKGSKDGLRISRELFHCGLGALVMILIWGILLAIKSDNYANTVVVAVGFHYVFFWSIIFPLRESYKKITVSNDSSSDHSPSVNKARVEHASKVSQRFEEVLTTPKKLEEFKQFLVLELSIENLLFYLDIQEWKRDYEQPWNNAEQIRIKANELFHKYLDHKSAYEVNLPHEMVIEIKSLLSNDQNNLPQTLFNRAEMEIRMLMQQDTFRRFEFKQSKLHAKEMMQVQVQSTPASTTA